MGKSLNVKSGSLIDRIGMGRVQGLLFLIGSLVLGKMFVLDVLDAAAKHAPDVHYSFKAMIAAVLCFAVGLFMIVAGKSPNDLCGENKALNIIATVVSVVVVGAGFALY